MLRSLYVNSSKLQISTWNYPDLDKIFITQNVVNLKFGGTKDENNIRHQVVKNKSNVKKDGQPFHTLIPNPLTIATNKPNRA